MDIVPPFYTEKADSEPTAAWEFRVGFRRFLTVSGSGEDARNKGWEGPFGNQRDKKDRAAAAKRLGNNWQTEESGLGSPNLLAVGCRASGSPKKKARFSWEICSNKRGNYVLGNFIFFHLFMSPCPYVWPGSRHFFLLLLLPLELPPHL